MLAGKRDHEGKKNGTIMKKLNKSNSVTDVTKKGNGTSASSRQTPLIESFYPKFKKEKVNSSLDECPVIDQKDSEEDSDEILIFKRRKRMPEEKSKACSISTPVPEVEQVVDKGLGLKHRHSDNDGGSGTCGNDDTNSRFLHTIISYLACISIWSQILTTGGTLEDYLKTSCPRMYPMLLVRSKIIILLEFFNSTFSSYHFLLYPDSTSPTGMM